MEKKKKIFDKSYQPIDLQLDDFLEKLEKITGQDYIAKSLNIHNFIDSNALFF